MGIEPTRLFSSAVFEAAAVASHRLALRGEIDRNECLRGGLIWGMAPSALARSVVALALLGLACLAPQASAALSGSLVDSSRFTVEGDGPSMGVGRDVAAVGDFNGDGAGDLAFSTGGLFEAPGVDLVLGGGGRSQVRIGPRSGGIRFVSPSEGAVAAAGDVNADGLSDLVVGSEVASPDGRDHAGSVFVVFGTRTPRSAALGDPALAGFRVDGPYAQAHIGWSVDGVGDVDGDGYGDVAIGIAPYPREVRPRAFVVYGKPDGDPVDLAALGDDGFEIATDREAEERWAVVSAAGDVNGDGGADVAALFPGGAEVVFGQRRTGVVDLSQDPAAGVRIAGRRLASVAEAGDFNGDGKGDMVLGIARGLGASVPGAGTDPPGHAVVIFGRAAGSVDARSLGTQGVLIRRGGPGNDRTGEAVAGAGDFDGDGFADVALGAPGESRVHVVRGDRDSGEVRLTSTGDRVISFEIVRRAGDPAFAGRSLDGGFSWEDWPRPALLVGATRGDPGGEHRGRAFVVAGFQIGKCRNRQTAPRGGGLLRGTLSGDTLVGGRGGDRLLGLEGADCLPGGRGRDRAVGGPGDDRLDGGAGARDHLDGGRGNDRLVDRAGRGTRILGGPGNDTVDVRNRRRDKVDCGRGRDRVRADRQDRLRHCERVLTARR